MKYNEEAVELLGEIIEPAIEIFTDNEVMKSFGTESAVKTISLTFKKHPKEIVEIIKAIDGDDAKDKYTAADIITRAANIINDKELMSFFTSVGQQDSESVSGTVTGPTQAEETN